MKNVFLISLMLIMISSCDNPKLEYGYVTNRDYRPAYTSVMVLPIVIGGKAPMVIMIPYIVSHSESWAIEVTGVTQTGDSTVATYYLSADAFDTMPIGKFVCVQGMCDEDTGYHKVRKTD